jgi:hypothetical protein
MAEALNPISGHLRLAFADPPYLGCCKLYGHRHEESWGCWDDPAVHGDLIDHLFDTFDGWAVSGSAASLYRLLPLFPEPVRVAAWVKPFAAYKANVRIAYTWEPVLFVPGRDSSKDGAPVGRDHLSEPITLQKGLTGAKPERFCRWVADLLGYVEGDELVDIFPGTDIMGRTLAQGRLV